MAKQIPLKERRVEAEKLVLEIQDEFSRIKKEIKKSLNELEEAKKINSNFKKLIPDLNNVSSKVEETLSNFRSDRDRLKRLLNTADNFYDKKFIPLQKKILNKETGLSKTITKGRQLEKQFNSVKISHQKQVTAIKQLVSESRQKNNELKRIEANLRAINTSILDTEKTVEEKRKAITEADIIIEASKNKIPAPLNVLFSKTQD